MGKFEIKTHKGGQFHFVLKSSNGEVVLTSEAYTTKVACTNGIESVKKNSQNSERFVKLTSSNSKFYFNLKATNGEVIGTSEMYETEKYRDNGISTVQKIAQDAVIVSV